MGNFLKYLFIGLVVITIAGGLIFTFTIDRIVQNGMEDMGSEMTGTTVSVEGVSISPLSGQGTITGFTVANPEGYNRDEAIRVEEISIELDVMSLFADEMVIRELILESPFIQIEQKLPENNIREIMEAIEAASDEETEESYLIIDRFLMRNGSADLYTEVGGERSATVQLEELELTDIGREETGQTTRQVVRQIAEPVAERALQAAIESGGEQIRDALEGLFN